MNSAPYSYLSTFARRGGGRYYQAMHSNGFPLSPAWEEKARALAALDYWAAARLGALKIRAEVYDGDSGAWVSQETGA